MKLTSPVLTLLVVCGAAVSPTPATAQQSPRSTRDAASSALLERAAESRARGSADAPVLVYEIADFQCPFCARFAQDVFHQIDSAYIATGQVQWVFVNLPMPSHARAWIASEAALCAGAVSDRFWVLHDRLFSGGDEWVSAADPATVLARYASEAGVDMESFNDCVASDRVAAIILQDVIFGSRVTGTPTFVVNHRTTSRQQTIVGVKSFGDWREVLDTALRAKE